MTNKTKREETIRNKAFVINPFKFPEFKGEDGLIRVSDVEGIIEAELKAQLDAIEAGVPDEPTGCCYAGHPHGCEHCAFNQCREEMLRRIALIRNKIGV